MVVGDSDFIADPYSIRRINLFGSQMMQPINDNLAFVLNSVEFLSGSQDLIRIRSRGQFSRPFTTVQGMLKEAQVKYQAEEKRLSEKLTQVRKQLKELEQNSPSKAGGGGQRLLLSTEMVSAVEKFREEERATSKALREVRNVLRQDIKSLGNTLLILNLLLIPVIIGIFGYVRIRARSRRSGRHG